MTDDPKNRPVSRTRLVVALLVALVCGALVALQSRINGELGGELSDGFVAAVISFGSGLVIVSVVLALSRAGRRGLITVRDAVRARELPRWHLLGGLGGGLFVLSQGVTVGIIGVALFTVAAVAGQTISGLVIDARGIGTVAPKRVTVARIIGSVVALGAVGISVGPDLSGNVPLWVVIAPFVVGLVLGLQQALNGQVKTLADSAVTATFFNFVAGTALLLIFAIVNVSIAGWPRSFPTNPTLYIGGLVGVVFIAGFAAVIPIVGVLLQSLAAVSGQLLMSMLLAVVAPTNTTELAWTTVVGTILTLVGVVIASVPSRKRATAS
ncbi:MAG: family transporter [Glaciihabitans sp.]|nr:family transporter [Glaciihabitans sp.]